LIELRKSFDQRHDVAQRRVGTTERSVNSVNDRLCAMVTVRVLIYVVALLSIWWLYRRPGGANSLRSNGWHRECTHAVASGRVTDVHRKLLDATPAGRARRHLNGDAALCEKGQAGQRIILCGACFMHGQAAVAFVQDQYVPIGRGKIGVICQAEKDGRAPGGHTPKSTPIREANRVNSIIPSARSPRRARAIHRCNARMPSAPNAMASKSTVSARQSG
jgi:hypothetical protein